MGPCLSNVFLLGYTDKDFISCVTDCSSPEIQFAVNNGRSVDSGVSLTVGDVLTCSAEGASSYRWTNVLNSSDAEIYGNTLGIKQPGSFNYECTVFMDCGTGTFCPFTRNISGLATGKHRIYSFCSGNVHVIY